MGYRHSTTDITSLCGTQVLSMCEDNWGKALKKYHSVTVMYKREKNYLVNYNISGELTACSIFSGNSDNLWVGSYSGLVWLDPRTGKAKSYKFGTEKTASSCQNTITCVFEDSWRRLWMGTNTGEKIEIAPLCPVKLNVHKKAHLQIYPSWNKLDYYKR